MFQRAGLISRVGLVFGGFAYAMLMGGCNPVISFIDHISFAPSSNLETVRVSVVFSSNIKSDLAGGFVIKDYGFLFINPYTQSEPFEVGFSLNTSIANDQDYVNITPTQILPNGMPIGIDYALVELRGKTPISSKFDLFGYVDVLHAAWLGAAGIFSFLTDQYFPSGLSVSQTFMPDAQGKPGIIASVFGPSLNTDGTLRRAGGVAVFANIKQLVQHPEAINSKGEQVFYPYGRLKVEGPDAAAYRADPRKLLVLQNQVIEGFNQK